jgi:hypothetical protein
MIAESSIVWRRFTCALMSSCLLAGEGGGGELIEEHP